MNSYFRDKHIWITGASSGIGEALARALAGANCRLSLSARRFELLERLACELTGAGTAAAGFPLDVSEREAVYNCHESVVESHGPVDILIANAGISQNSNTTLDLEQDLIDRLIGVNLTGAIHTIKAVLPSMTERQQGQIVGVSSLAGFRGLPASAIYCATKAALSCFLEGLRLELRDSGIAVTDVCPGFIKTPMTENNDHPMPFLMEVEACARILLRGIKKRKAHLGFPWQLHNALRLSRNLPPFLYDRVIGLVDL